MSLRSGSVTERLLGRRRSRRGTSKGGGPRRRVLRFEPLEDRRLLTAFLVDSAADNTHLDGLVTLREAVGAANSDSPVGDAPAGNGADEIQFAAALAGQTITLAGIGMELVVAEDLTIVGLGWDQLTLDGNDWTRHFEVNPGVRLTLSGLTLTNGNAGEGTSGGSFYVDGSLVLSDCVLSNNRAGQDGGAIYAGTSSPSVTLTDCVVTGSQAANLGGGMYQAGGSSVLTATAFSGNTALHGGGLYTLGPAQIVQGSVFQGNAATGGDGGGVYATDQLVITDSRFEANTAAGYGGGFWAGGLLTITGNLYTANTAQYGGGGYARNNSLAVLTDVTFSQNQASVDGGAWYSNYWRPVQMSGGSFTNNHADRHGGAVGGPDSAEIRGVRFERNTAGVSGGAIYSWGALRISDSLFDANTAAGAGGALNTWGPNILETCTFTGNAGSHGGAINHLDQLLTIGGNSLFANNTATYDGGAVRNCGPGTYLNSTFQGNQAGNVGGAIEAYNDDFSTTIQDCLIEQNQAGPEGSGNGGGIWTNQRRLEIAGTTIRHNTTDDDGGAIYVSEGLLVLTNSLVADNVATTERAGGIWVGLTAELSLANSTVSGNVAGRAGGGLYFDRNTNLATLVNATISGNRADSSGTTGQLGGGIYMASAKVLLQNTIVAGNLRQASAIASDIEGSADPASNHNLIGDAATGGGLTHGVNANLVGVDPQLDPLQDNGGRSLTHALLAGSPAIDAGDNARALAADGEPLWYDQRGASFDRLVGLHVDLGAFEYETPGAEIHGRKWFDLDQDDEADETWGLSIVTNGGFEQGALGTGNLVTLNAGSTALTGWDVLRAVDSIRTTWSPAEGARSIDLSAQSAGALAQPLVTQPGRRYRVQFALAGNPQGAPALKTVRVSAAGTHQDFTFDTTGHSTTDMGWQTETWEFVAQGTLTALVFESLTDSGYGPALDNVVVQPFGRDDARIYLDQDGSGQFDAGEPLTFLRPDNPATAEVDETGTYRFIGLPAGTYTIRELLADGFTQIDPDPPGSYSVTLAALQVVTDQDFGNRWAGMISGTKFLDLNNNGVRDRNPLPGNSPTVLMVLDVSDTCGRNAGFAVEDQNGHGGANDVLDAEIYAMLQVRQELVTLGWEATAQVGIVVFAADAVSMDMDPLTAGVQLFASPVADADGNGTNDVEQVLRALRPVQSGTTLGTTDFEAALQASHATLTAAPPAGETVLFFTSDGLSNNPWVLADELAALDALGVRRTAWGFGINCDLSDLRRIDPFARQLHSTTEIVMEATARSRAGTGDGRWLEPGLAGVTIYLDADGDDQLGPGETSTVTRADDPATTDVDEEGWYAFSDLPLGSHVVREIVPLGYVPTAPLNPDEYRVDLRTGPTAAGYDFGNRPAPGSISGRKGLDADFDGLFELGEPGQAGVIMYLDLNNNGTRDTGEPTAVTDTNGQFAFHDVTPGQYVVRESTPDGFEQIQPEQDQGLVVQLETDGSVTDLLFVNWDLRGCVQGMKWIDLDGDAQHDDGEPGLAGVRIYLDVDGDGVWDAIEPYAWTQADDPATAEVDETGMWTMAQVVPGSYTVREVSPSGFEPGFPGPNGHLVTVDPRGLVVGLAFGNVPQLPSIEGWKFEDYNENGRRDSDRLRGNQPLLVLAVDVSDSTRNPFVGEAPGDVNADGEVDTLLDGELAGLIAVNQALVGLGWGATLSVAVVAFGEQGFQIDMDPAAPGLQLITSPAADADGDGAKDVEQVLRSLVRADFGSALRTDYGAALDTVGDTVTAVNPLPGNANLLFVSDGEPNNPNDYGDEVAQLQALQVNLNAFGAGSEATLYTLRIIDPGAALFTSPAELVAGFVLAGVPSAGGGSGSLPGSADGLWAEPGVSGVIVYLDADNDGQWDAGEGERWTVTEADDPATPNLDETGRYRFDGLSPGTHVVREIVPAGWIPSALVPYLADESLISYFPFSGNTVDQISGTAATNNGAVLTADQLGRADMAYRFDGADWMTASIPALPLANAPWTMSVWAQSSDGQSGGTGEFIASWGGAGDAPAVAMKANWGLWMAVAGTTEISTGVRVDLAWHQFVMIYDGTTFSAYVDGQRRTQRVISPQVATGLLYIGCRPDVKRKWAGTIDDFRLYDRALAESEVAGLFAWERNRTVVAGGHVVRVTYGEFATGLDFGNSEVSVADAGGPYTSGEGATLALDGSGSAGAITRYEWDLDYDGARFDVDATGAQPEVSLPDDGPPRTIALRVTDAAQHVRVASTTLTVTNGPPVVDAGFDLPDALRGQPVSVAATFTDPGVLDTHTAVIDWGDGTPAESFPVSEPADGQPGTVQASHVYAAAGVRTVTVTVTDDDGGTGSDTLVVIVHPGTLIVTEFQPTGSGFSARFSRGLEPSVLNLYDSASQTLGPADVLVTGATVGSVRGSLVLSADQRQITFVQTGGLLEPDTYTVTLFSGAARFREPTGETLDGNADGTAGDDYQTAFTVSARPAGSVTVRVPDIARGAGQGVNVPNTATGLPIRLDSVDGVTSLAVDLMYDPELLEITAAALAAGMPADWTVVLDTATPGVAKITASGPTPLSGTNVEVVRLTAAVPNAAAYGEVQAIRLENLVLNGGTIAAVGDVVVHKAAYLGDADSSGVHSSADAFLTVQAALGLASGFGAHAWTDPRIVGDADGSGLLSAADAFLIVQEGLGLSEPFVPDNPHIEVTPVGGGVDPQFQIDANIPAGAGALVTVPVMLDIEEAATNVGAWEFDLFFDSTQLTIRLPEDVWPGADTAGWAVSATLVAPGQLRVGMVSSNGQPLTPGLREIARLQFGVEPRRTGWQPVRDGLPTRPTLLTPITDELDGWDGLATRPTWLDIEPVDARAGGYAWTAADGSLLIGPGPAVEGCAGWLGRDLPEGVLPLEDALSAMAEDVAEAWR